jgi:DNA repair exonuclease SbcCD ATPase subunit
MTWNSDYIDLQNNKKILEDCINKYNIYRKQLCTIIVDNYENPMSIDMMNNYYIILDYIEHLKNNIKFVKNMDAIKKITKLDNILEKVDVKLSIYNKELTQLTYEMALYKSQYDEYNNIIDNMKKNSTKYNIYSVLKKASHINGVPSKIISTRLNEVNTRVNELISQFINKKVFVLLDGTNILVHIKDNMENIINILGGMEMFIINIAFKIALANVSIIPKNKMIIIDEGVSVLDKQHIERFDKIAMFLNSNYDHVILISHIDSLKDFISHYITINKNADNLSHINFL